MPRALARAGFEVVLLTPKDSLAEKSRYVAKLAYLDDASTPRQWLHAFAATVKATSPRLVMPCDEMAYRLLQTLVVSPPPGLAPALALELGALIRYSMGEPAHYGTSVDKTLLPPAAEALGVRVPPHAIVATTEEVERFAGIHGYPLVLKRRRSSSGSGVVICADRSAIERAMIDLSTTTAEDLSESTAGRLIVQAHISGPIRFYPTMAWKGAVLTGYAGQKLMSNPGPKSPPTVNRYYRSPQLRAISTKLAAGFQITGFFSPEFVEDARSGLPYLMEINRRLVGGAHRGSAINVDHCAALHAALHGMPSPTRADLDEGEEHFTIHFPQEWLRDPGSSWLREYPVDVPWDEPELIEAMLALRHE